MPEHNGEATTVPKCAKAAGVSGSGRSKRAAAGLIDGRAMLR